FPSESAVSRVLLPPWLPCAAGDHSSGHRVAAGLERPVPGGLARRGPRRPPFGGTPLFGLAPGGVWRAPPVTRRAVGSYPTVSPLPACAGGLFSVPLSFGLPRLAVSQHPALGSSDFPRTARLAAPGPRSPRRLRRETL